MFISLAAAVAINTTLMNNYYRSSVTRPPISVPKSYCNRLATIKERTFCTRQQQGTWFNFLKIQPKYNKLVKLAILDTGFNQAQINERVKLCPTGHYDASTNTLGITSVSSHGSYVAGAAAEVLNASEANYCIIIINIFTPQITTTEDIVAQAVNHAVEQGADAINLSITGGLPSEIEKMSLKRASLLGTKVFIAAGNNAGDLNKICNNFPACYKLPEVRVVGALKWFGGMFEPAGYSNTGLIISEWFIGDFLPKTGAPIAQGTSFASPRAAAYYLVSKSQLKPIN